MMEVTLVFLFRNFKLFLFLIIDVRLYIVFLVIKFIRFHIRIILASSTSALLESGGGATPVLFDLSSNI